MKKLESETMCVKERFDEKLKKDQSNLAALRDALSRSDKNTQGMLSILESFDNRLKRLNNTIVPVYQETENLRRRQENIEKTMGALDEVLSHYHVTMETHNMIKDGPQSHGLDIYIRAMTRIVSAMQYFNDTNPNCPEITAVTTLFQDGCESLFDYFKSLLDRHGKPVSSVTLLNAIGEAENEDDSQKPAPMQQLPARVVAELHDIAHWLFANTTYTDFLQVYMRSRSTLLVKSIQGIKEHSRYASGGSLSSHSQTSPSLAPKFRGNKDVPSRRSFNKKLSFMKSATKNLIKSPFDSGYKRQLTVGLETMKEEGSTEVDVDYLIMKISALFRLIQNELLLLNRIIPEKHTRMAFDNIVQQALDILLYDADQLASNARSAISRRDYGSILVLFPVIKHLRAIKPEFEKCLEGCQAPTRAKLASLHSTLNQTGAKALEEFIESIRNDPDKSYNMPKDGTVHELANHTILFLESLQEYSETSGMMLFIHAGAGGSSNPELEKAELKLAEYMTKVLSALGLNLSNKAESYTDVVLRSVFMLNNYNYILKSLTKTGLLNLILTFNDEIAKYYQDQIINHKHNYMQCWGRILQHIQEVNKPLSLDQRAPTPELVKLKDKERQIIKDKFSGFNKELEELLKVQKCYAIPDSELRETLKSENKQFILPKFENFYDKYKRYHFTRNADKYLKYNSESVANLLDRFFDASA